MANEWADPSDLAGMSRGGDLLGKMGYDREALMSDPALRAEMMQKVAGPYSATAPAQQSATPSAPTGPQIPNPRSPNGNDISAPPGAPRLINRQEPTVPAPPPRPLPATLGGAPAPTPASMAGSAPPTSSAVSPSGTPTPSVETQNSRQAVGNLLAPEPELPDTSKEDAMIAAKSMPINPNTSIGGKQIYKEGLLGKLGRIGKGAAIGFAGHPDDAVSINAPNDRFNLDDQTRQAQLGLANKQRADAIAAFKEKSDLRKQQDTASKDAGDISNTAAKLPNETTVANADAARSYNESPQGKAEAQKQLDATTLADRMAQVNDPKNPLSKLGASEKAVFVAGGRAPEPYHPDAGIQSLWGATQAYIKENGHPPQTLDDYLKIQQTAKGESGGQTMMVPDGKGGMTATTVKPGDTVPAGTTTTAGMAMDARANAAGATKEAKAAQSIVDEADLAHQAAQEAANGNAEGDVDLMLSFFKTMKGSSGAGIRFTQQEQNLIKGARSSGQDLMAIGQKVIGSGQSLTPTQRENVLRIIDLHANAAKNHLNNGQQPGKTDSTLSGEAPEQRDIKTDADGHAYYYNENGVKTYLANSQDGNEYYSEDQGKTWLGSKDKKPYQPKK